MKDTLTEICDVGGQERLEVNEDYMVGERDVCYGRIKSSCLRWWNGKPWRKGKMGLEKAVGALCIINVG